MTAALASRVDAAVAGLREPEQRVLALRERDGADYRAIAAEISTGREGVADLLVAARLGVWAAMHEDVPPRRRTPQCGPARRVLAAQADGEAVSATDADRAREHLAGCDQCQSARLALREAELACRAWRTTTPITSRTQSPAPSVSRNRGNVPSKATRSRLAAGRRRLAVAAVAAVLLVAILFAALSGSDDAPPPPAPPPTGQGSAEAPGTDVVPPPGDRFCPAEDPDCR